MRPTIVQKYGGSSVADVVRLRAIAATVVARRRAGNNLVVVVSAMGKTTDQLIAQASAISDDPSRRELDMLVTAGERISMALLSIAIQEAGEQAISFTGSQSGIITTCQHQDARILEVRPQRIETALAAGKIVIVAGYQGVSRSREVTTLGRGGSDTTAVALAAALQAEACEIYSDVDGIYSADPRMCPNAQHLPEVPFGLMHAMAGAGARVLNVDAVEFARRADITIVARQTDNASRRETVVSKRPATLYGVAAVVDAAHVSWLAGATEELPDAFWPALQALGARIITLCPQALLVDRTGVPGQTGGAIQKLARDGNLSCTEGGAITLLGTGLLGAPLAHLRQKCRELEIFTYFGTDTCLTCLLPTAAMTRVLPYLHDAFILQRHEFAD